MAFFDLFDKGKRILKKIEKEADEVLAYYETIKNLSNEELKEKTSLFKERLQNGESLDNIAKEVFAVAMEATKRIEGITLHKNQIETSYVLHNGDVAELKTGEGKTHAAVGAVYLNALTGKGVHVITANEYLAERDFNWTKPIYDLLGIKVGINLSRNTIEEKQYAYNCDVTFSTASEICFDYLRDNMATEKDKQVLRELNFALIDEADFALIDEAKTPLILSGALQETSPLYFKTNEFVKELQSEDYERNIKENTVYLNKSGIRKAEKFFNLTNLYAEGNEEINHYIFEALRANYAYKKDIDYIIKNNEICIVDKNTGRLLLGRELGDGLHQAIQVKEGLPVKKEKTTIATITYQNFFKLYKKLAGMTGTAKTEEEEFLSIYNMKVVEIPSHKPIQRIDYPDLIYATKKAKYNALINEVETLYKKGQPVLVGTISVEDSEFISTLLSKKGLPHNVLNAKNHAKEAEIISNAGIEYSITVATNMAGRGTDIKLTEKSRELGGLAVIGSERHESRRIDNQLRGRSGRQGDPGYSRFYVSLQDELMVRFGNQQAVAMVNLMGEGPYENKALSKAILNAQKRVEGANFDLRKNLLDFDLVVAKQREIIYKERQNILKCSDFDDFLKSIVTNYKEFKQNNPDTNKLRKRILRSIDSVWIKQIDELEKLRDGISMRNFGRLEPIEAYKRDAYYLFKEKLEIIKEKINKIKED